MPQTPEEIKAYKKEWCLRNKERLRIKSAAYYLTTKEHHQVMTTKWKQENKERYNFLSRKQHAKRTTSDPIYREKCRNRTRKYYIKHRKKCLEKARAERGPKYIARYKAQNALKSGLIIKPTFCEWCRISGVKLTMHHHDYLKPLDVIFLCTACHGIEKKKDRPLSYQSSPSLSVLL